MELLTCTRCKTGKEPTLANFPPNKAKTNGLDSWCRACRSSYRSTNCRGKFRDVISDEDLSRIKSEVKECVICGDDGPLVVDHDHVTGAVRGMLCNRCNCGLGMFRDSPRLLEFAAQYLFANSSDPAGQAAWEDYLSQHKAA